MSNLADRLDRARAGSAKLRAPRPRRPTRGAVPDRRRVVDPFAGVKERVHQALVESLGPRLYDPHLPEAELAAQVRTTLQEVIDSEQTPLSHADRTRIAQDVSDDILGHGPLEPFLRDPEVTEIMVNGAGQHLHRARAASSSRSRPRFSDESHLRRTIDKIVGRVGRRVDESSPMVDARLPDGSRVNAVVPPIALDGSMLTIRKFAADPFTDRDLIAFGTMTPSVRDFLDAVRPRPPQHHHLAAAPARARRRPSTSSARFIPHDERIVTIEDAAELQLQQEHVLRLEVAPGQHRGPRRDHDPRPRQELACVCAPTASSSVRSVTAPRSTCSRP